MKNFLQFCGYVLMQSTDAERKIKWKKFASNGTIFQCSTVHIVVCTIFAQNAQAT